MSLAVFKGIWTVSIILVALFLFTVLTVESHGTGKGLIRDQLPTISEEDATFAIIDIQASPGVGLYSLARYLNGFQEITYLGAPVVCGTIYRGPPNVASL